MATRELLSGPVTLSDAAKNARDVLLALKYPGQRADFYKRIERQLTLLSDAVAHHLRAPESSVIISPQEYWRHGSFNLLVPVAFAASATPGTPPFVSLRFPLPYRNGEAHYPGNSDEKLNCEAATYAWIQENCQAVPIPQLYGFGFAAGQRFTHIDWLPWWLRWLHQARQYVFRWLGLRLPSRYVYHPSRPLDSLDTGYLLVQTITAGQMLSESWDDHKDETCLQNNLRRSLAKIMLSLSSIPLPRIGSFRLDNDGYLHLDNRPLSVQGIVQENEGISIEMPRRRTFSRVDDFILHHLTNMDTRLLHQPNSIVDEDDAWYQMTSLTAARAIFPRMFRREFNSGPFAYTFTDLHRSNIFVDKDWNITTVVDLEFTCSWPVEFIHPPYWLSGELVDEIRPEDFASHHADFIRHVQEEEKLEHARRDTEPLSSIMQRGWTDGTFWVTMSLLDPVGFTDVFYRSILPFYFSCSPGEVLAKADYKFFSLLWKPGVPNIIGKKLKDRESYMEELSLEFAKADARDD